MDHGGQDEAQQDEQDARQLRNIHDANCAGGAAFEWLDEWWKRSWIVDDLALPYADYPIWHNVTNPEQNFGLLAFDPAQPGFNGPPLAIGSGRIETIQATTDPEYFHVRVGLASGLSAGETLAIGFDTYGDDVGESILPNGTQSARRSELALVVSAPSQAQLYVTQAYDLFGMWFQSSTDSQLYHSTATDGAPWDSVRWENNVAHTSADGSLTFFPEAIQPIGALRVRNADDPPSSRDAVVVTPQGLDVRLPWTLLQFTDPTTSSVMDDDRSTPAIETAVSAGIAVSVALGAELLETPRVSWTGWQSAPATTERLKASAGALTQVMHSL
jgi:hypothetical protein